MQLAQLYLKLTVVRKHKNRHFFYYFRSIAYELKKSDEPINLAGIDFVSRKVRVVISIHERGYNVPGLNPYFIPLFQFVDKVS